MENKINTGAIFKNDKKSSDKQPDYTGKINVDGKEKQIALWVKEGTKGKYFSVAVSDPYVKQDIKPVSNGQLPPNKEDFPF